MRYIEIIIDGIVDAIGLIVYKMIELSFRFAITNAMIIQSIIKVFAHLNFRVLAWLGIKCLSLVLLITGSNGFLTNCVRFLENTQTISVGETIINCNEIITRIMQEVFSVGYMSVLAGPTVIKFIMYIVNDPTVIPSIKDLVLSWIDVSRPITFESLKDLVLSWINPSKTVVVSDLETQSPETLAKFSKCLYDGVKINSDGKAVIELSEACRGMASGGK